MPVSADGILEAVFDPAWASVRLVVDGGMWPSPVAAITITREIPGAAPVALRGVEARAVVGGSYVGSDHEAPLESSVIYAVTGFDSAGASVAVASVVVDTSGAAWGLWVKAPGKPDLTTWARFAVAGEVGSRTIGGVYQIAGGGGSVAQTTAQWSGAESDRVTVQIAGETPAGVARLRAVFREGRILLLQAPGSTDLEQGWYFVEDVRRANPAQFEDFPERWFTLDLRRTGVPVGQGSGIAGNTWARLADEYATWADVLAAFDTWFDVLKGA